MSTKEVAFLGPAFFQPFRAFLACLHWLKQKWRFWRSGFYPANQSNLKSILNALIGWKKAGPPKKPLLFW